MFCKRITHTNLFENLDDEFLLYIIKKIDEYKEAFIEKNWSDVEESLPLSEAHKLIDMETFKLKIKKEIMKRNGGQKF